VNRFGHDPEIAPQGTIDLLKQLTPKIKGRRILHTNCTSLGGGVDKILRSLIPLHGNIGIEAPWEVIEKFFNTTKAFHKALRGRIILLPPICSYTIYRSGRKTPGRIS